MSRLVATASPASGSETSGGALAGIQDVGVELGLGRFALKVHARTRKVLTFVRFDGRAACRRAQGEDDGQLHWTQDAFSPCFSGAK